MRTPDITDAHLAKLRDTLTSSSPIDLAEIGREHLLAIVDDLIERRSLTVQYPYESPQGHADALADSGEAYSQHNGWTLNCLWCDYPAQGKTKAEALAVMQRHYDGLGVNAELR
ncbi:hypothetical protein [Arthrobacter sp. A2-55]|uniref:hypothetical protein n=1 Tax=Arthrobacter sp. A2-55 TaxID=2897337 RepID=UPI0021CDE498|nr:hypothetical protein [Arthrobacter sp. A2-55]MCU6480517.1 hypothetical protein [Arthrobacter sp. A2-55]